MTVDEIKTIVINFSIDKCTINQVQYLQRYFILKYCCWMPMRAIAVVTDGLDHTTIRDAVNAVENNSKLFNLSLRLKMILDAKIENRSINLNGVRLWSQGPKYKTKNHK